LLNLYLQKTDLTGFFVIKPGRPGEIEKRFGSKNPAHGALNLTWKMITPVAHFT